MVHTPSYFRFLSAKPFGYGFHDVEIATKNTFLHLQEKGSQRPRRARSAPCTMNLYAGEPLSAFDSPRSWATTPGGRQMQGSPKLTREILQFPSEESLQEITEDSSQTEEETTCPWTNCNYNSVESSLQDPSGQVDPALWQEDVYTVMIKNIPCGCSQEEVLSAIAEGGFEKAYDFFYLPTRRSKDNFGYAFIGFPEPGTARNFAAKMNGFRFASRRSVKTMVVVPARVQGLKNNLAHFRTTRIFHSKLAPIFKGGERTPQIANCPTRAVTESKSRSLVKKQPRASKQRMSNLAH